ncbi:MAG TPA: glycosyltransferase family 4 protein [Planctomycetota bacterium]
MKVLHLISGRGPTGAAAAAMTDVKALLAAGHTAMLATRDDSGLMQACKQEALPCVGGFKFGRGAMRLLHLPHDVRRLRALLRELSIDVLHVHRSNDQLLSAAALGRTFAVRLVRTWHRDPISVPRLLLSRLAAQVDGCVCVSREHAQTLNSAGASACEYIPVAVDTEVFRPGEARGQEPRAKSQELIFRIGQVGRWKLGHDGRDRGQAAALDVFAELARDLHWRGLLIGRGELGEQLRQTAYTEKGLPKDRVELIEFQKHSPAEFAALLSTLHLGLLFNTGSDGTSRTGAELLACGVPLVVADRPGLRELAEDTACALRQLPDDARGWARAVEDLLRNPERLAEMSVAARRRAEQVHSLKARGEALGEFYRQAPGR